MDIYWNMFLEFFNIDFSFAVSDAIGYHDGSKFTVLQNGLRYFFGDVEKRSEVVQS